MVVFNELRITPDGLYLIIDVSVKDSNYYQDVYIDNIQIDTQDTYADPKHASSERIYFEQISGDNKHIRKMLTPTELLGKDLNSNMFFVYITCKGQVTSSLDPTNECLPCGGDEYTTMGTVVANYPYYELAMSYIGELSENCTIPKDFIDFILRTKAMELAVKTGNYPEAIKFYNKFFKDTPYISERGGCGCGGI